MQNTSALYQQIVSGPNYWFETRLTISGAGTFGEDKLFSMSTTTEMFHNTPEVGTAVSGEIEIKMLNPSVTIPTMAVLYPYVRAVGMVSTGGGGSITDDVLTADGATLEDGILVFADGTSEIDENNILVIADSVYEQRASEWVQQGVFFIDTRETEKSEGGVETLTIHGFDAMLKAEQMFSSTRITGNSTDIQMVNEIARIIGVSVDPRTTAIMTMGYTIPLPTGYTLREILGYIGSMYVGGFVMSDTGQLRLISVTDIPPETNYLINEDDDCITFGGDRILV